MLVLFKLLIILSKLSKEKEKKIFEARHKIAESLVVHLSEATPFSPQLQADPNILDLTVENPIQESVKGKVSVDRQEDASYEDPLVEVKRISPGCYKSSPKSGKLYEFSFEKTFVRETRGILESLLTNSFGSLIDEQELCR